MFHTGVQELSELVSIMRIYFKKYREGFPFFSIKKIDPHDFFGGHRKKNQDIHSQLDKIRPQRYLLLITLSPYNFYPARWINYNVLAVFLQ